MVIMVWALMFPDKKWARFLEGKGYEGFLSKGNDLAIFSTKNVLNKKPSADKQLRLERDLKKLKRK